MFILLRSVWHKLPDDFRRGLARTGLPYALSFILRYRKLHQIENFAGNLTELNANYAKSTGDAKLALERQFERIVDALVMPNGVKKTTYGKRLGPTLNAVLSEVQLPKSEIRVLDLPSSTGVTSLQNLELVQTRYRVADYVLGDLYHGIRYDADRGCIFDEQGNLLQVAFKKYYYSIYKGHSTGEQYNVLTALLLLPHSAIAWCLEKIYRARPGQDLRRLVVVHPEVERMLGHSPFRLEVMDVFKPIPGRYDLILSFNLLQKNYFPPAVIAAGVANLAESLNEGGVLVLGDTESFTALQKANGALVTRMQKGQF